MALDSIGEFGRIARFFAPLAAGYPGALGLTDDAAIVDCGQGDDLVVTTDAIVESVHFLPVDPPDLVARKLLRVNLSDLAAKGARPEAYFLTLALPERCGDDWVERFAQGLGEDQAQFGICLAGGDSVATPGPITLGVTALGRVGRGRMIRRSGAQPGDGLYVSGTIGDAALGLLVATGRLLSDDMGARAYLEDRYRLPRPRLDLGARLIGLAGAGLDISDGLVGDVAHLASASRVGAVIHSSAVPLSEAAAAQVADNLDLMETILTAGDDYELAFTASAECEHALQDLSASCGVLVTRIGDIVVGEGVSVLDKDRQPIRLARTGYRHG